MKKPVLGGEGGYLEQKILLQPQKDEWPTQRLTGTVLYWYRELLVTWMISYFNIEKELLCSIKKYPEETFVSAAGHMWFKTHLHGNQDK